MTTDLTPSLLSRLHDPIVLDDHEIAVGVVFVQGAGHRVGTVTPVGLNHMSAAQARRMGRELGAHPSLSAAVEALNTVADRLDEMNAPQRYTDDDLHLANMPSMGSA